jgi:hypothetical protein
MTTRTAAALGSAATMIVLAVPGTALGATVSPLKPCYVSVPNAAREVEPIDIAGSGFTPNSKVDVSVDGAPALSGAPVDAAGAIAAGVQVPAPFIDKRDKPFQVVVTQQGNAANSVTLQSRVTALNVGVQPRRARPSSRVLFRGRGFTGAGKVYAHYRYKGKTRKTVTFTPQGACGTFATRKRQIPVSGPGTGRWTLQFDQQKTYSATPSTAFYSLFIDVTRTVRAK